MPIWKWYWSEAEVRGSSWFTAMETLSGLESVGLKIEADNSVGLFARSTEEMTVFEANVRLVGRCLGESATRARDPTAAVAARGRGREGCRLRVPKRVCLK